MGAPAVPACRNCGAAAGGKYCPECGQETAAHPPTAAEFLHEFVGHYVALEGALWRTLRALLAPGRLTLEYFAGRRRSDTFCQSLEQRVRAHFGSMTRRQAADYVAGRLVALFPYAMFVLLPVFALLTRAAYWNRPYNYGEHLVFAFHIHAFAFIAGTIAAPLRDPTFLTVPVAIYLALAMKKVFGGRTWPSTARFLLVFLAYIVLLIAAVTAIATAIALL